MRYREFVLSPYGVIKIKSLGYINNIQNRLQLLFGERYGLEIASPHKPKLGTSIKLRFPMQEVH
ncbi:hypothetical protein [Symbiopectobacterium purcellii]|uniref:hypothetical protein n=1 Tax=Symbiopectobacterium purcellii TaxID=2871826 RepID=UPI003F82B7AE